MSESTSAQSLLEAYHAKRKAEDAYLAAVAAAYPPGSEVEWMHGEHRQFGEVKVNGGGLLQVRNYYTGRTVRVDPFSVLLAYYTVSEILP